MSFGVYVHIPYCLQRCRYCDFATYLFEETVKSQNYIAALLSEIQQGAPSFHPQPLSTIYFGGGTPSLLNPDEILAILSQLEQSGFTRLPDCEVTLEINPATVTPEKLRSYQKMGINRFSVGAQTFQDSFLIRMNRKHTAEETRQTLRLLSEQKLNYSFDLLFALPHQTLEQLQADLTEVGQWLPPHISPYCLTVPEGHPMSFNRPSDDQQVEMFSLISTCLKRFGYQQYEISNFCLPGFESRHNSLYWADQPYWGLGLSSHSYNPAFDRFGARWWNPRSMAEYLEWVSSPTQKSDLLARPKTLVEILSLSESLTDFCHTSLRRHSGLSLQELKAKFGESIAQKVDKPAQNLLRRGLLSFDAHAQSFCLTEEGRVLSNQVFLELTFLRDKSAPV